MNNGPQSVPSTSRNFEAIGKYLDNQHKSETGTTTKEVHSTVSVPKVNKQLQSKTKQCSKPNAKSKKTVSFGNVRVDGSQTAPIKKRKFNASIDSAICTDCPSQYKKHTNAECFAKHPELKKRYWDKRTSVNTLVADQDADDQEYDIHTLTYDGEVNSTTTNQNGALIHNIGLDSMASVHAVCSKEHIVQQHTVSDVRLRTANDIATVNQRGKFKGFEDAGACVYIPNANVNLLSMGLLSKTSHIEYDNALHQFVITNRDNPHKVDIFRLDSNRNVYLQVRNPFGDAEDAHDSSNYDAVVSIPKKQECKTMPSP